MAGLPDYGKPPVVEVAIGIQFAPIAGLSVGHVGLYWATIRDTFGRVEEQAPLPHMVEVPEGAPEPTLGFQVLERPELPRTWFLDTSGARIIQLQRDRFVHNWRRMRPSDEYPRFPSVRDSFFRYWDGFTRFLGEHGLHADPDQCELTYVNHIKKTEGWNVVADLGQLFRTFAWRTRSDFLPKPDNLRWSLRFVFPDGNGRLYVDVLPVRVPPQNDPVIRFSLTAKGKPQKEITTATLEQWFAVAREWIVKGFTDLVDDTTDIIWERKS